MRASNRVRDEAASADKLAVIQLMRSGSVSESELPPERPPDLDSMSDQELRRFTKANYGFESI